MVDGVATRSTDHRLVVDAHLDDVRSGQLLWSAHFDRPDSQSQALQEQVAAKIAGVAHCALDAKGPSGGQADGGLLGIYLKACDLMHTSGGDVRRAICCARSSSSSPASPPPGRRWRP
jgi:hypothetical protein